MLHTTEQVLSFDNLEVYKYQVLSTFSQALNSGDPQRIFVTPQSDRLRAFNISFVNQYNDSVHILDYGHSDEQQQPIEEALPRLKGRQLLAGQIVVSPEGSNIGHVYQIIKPELKDGMQEARKIEEEGRAYQVWLETTRDILEDPEKSKIAYVQYYKNEYAGGIYAVDLTTQFYHLVTNVGLWTSFHPRDLRAVFPTLYIRDNSKVNNWIDVMETGV